MSTRTFPKSQRFLKISFFIGLFLFAFGSGFFVVNAAYERYATGDTAVIGEFVYDDNFVATTTAGCTLSIYNPSGTLLVNAASMTADANGYTHYSYSVPSAGPEGVWPAQMTCGSVPNGDLVKLDKTFVVGATVVSTTTLASSVWTSATRTLTSVGTLVADVWAYGTRTLTGASLDSGSLATQSDVLTASTSLASTIPTAVWANSSRSLTTFGTLVSDVWNASTRTLTSLTLSSQSPWTVSTSDFGSITAGSNYLANVTTVYNGTLTDSANLPTVTIYDPSRNVVVNGASMTRTGTGTYTYSYTTAGNAPAGTWESVFSATVESGKTLPGNDYWTVVTAPAQVIINNISDNVTPEIAANVTFTNEGTTGYEYQYEWCVVADVNNTCGGGDDVFHATAAKYINAGEDFNTTLTATVPDAGNYYFKTIVYFGTDSSGASRSFTATAPAVTPPSSGGSGGGGGGGGGGGPPTPVDTGDCRKSDFNCDKKVNSIDFSILLYFWKTKPPFSNPKVDINQDGKVNSVDFSILLYEWDKR